MSGDDEDVASLSTVIELPAEQKAQLELLCTRRGIAMRDYVERLVRAGLGIAATPSGRDRMARGGEEEHAEYDEVRYCKYGCNFHTKSKSGLAQHEAGCTYQRSRRAQERAAEIEDERRVKEVVIA